MPLSAPQTDPTAIVELFRGNYATELLTAAVSHFDLFRHLGDGPLTRGALKSALHLEERPFVVLTAALLAAGLLQATEGRLSLTPSAQEHLVPGGAFYIGDYVGLQASSPGVLELVARLRSNRPAGSDQEGAAFIFREGLESAMEREATARHLTLALSGRAKNVASSLAEVAPLGNTRRLLDVGGGTGLYAIACLERFPQLTAVVWDRPEVLKVAAEFRAAAGMEQRLELVPGDMFADPSPAADAILFSNVLHDWDVPECQKLITRCAGELPKGGQLLIHDVFLNDALDGPLPVALYSAALFNLTEGRAYSAAEYRTWLTAAGLQPSEVRPTLIHCGLLPAVKS